ncbi:hypothetical protein [Marinobacter salsuginis]|uniref:Uncharacterized protein n=1 Tax=Marinobacter salsuginis TaxID=418719 RepID=A0A5M3Q088_9GAMM|nr:hypothetical protein [Marinobacter salsuginis]GBO88603.1 hypothetical protein MSSD14B_22710 [Marinobacter salsuginis]
MTLEAMLVWGGLTVAILDSTGYGNDINGLFDRIITITATAIKKRKSPIRAWMNAYDSWLTIQAIMVAHESGLVKLPDSLAAQPAIKRRLNSNKSLRRSGQGHIVVRKQLDRILVAAMVLSQVAITLALGVAICSPLWFALEALDMHRGSALIVSGIFTVAFFCIFFRMLSRIVDSILEPLLAVLFALSIVALSIPLSIFRPFPTGYLSAFGLFFAGLGAFQYLTG